MVYYGSRGPLAQRLEQWTHNSLLYMRDERFQQDTNLQKAPSRGLLLLVGN